MYNVSHCEDKILGQGTQVSEKVEAMKTQAQLVLSLNSSSLLLKEVILHGINAFAGWELGSGEIDGILFERMWNESSKRGHW